MKLTFAYAAILGTASLVALASVACSSSTSSSANGGGAGGTTLADGGTGPNVPATGATTQSFETRMATADCAQQARCGQTAFGFHYADQADCVTQTTKSYVGTMHASATAIAEAQVDACVTAMGSQACTVIGQPEACNFKGTTENGAACAYSSQCKSGSCYAETDGACGVCKDSIAVGGDCSAASCASGAFCDSSGKCVAFAKENETCGKDILCDIALACSNRTATCMKLAVFGGDCSVATGSYCDFTMDCIDGRCVAQTTAALGATCGTDANGKTTSCMHSQCTGTDDNGANGKCTAWPAEGAACDDATGIACGQIFTCVDSACKLTNDVHVCK